MNSRRATQVASDWPQQRSDLGQDLNGNTPETAHEIDVANVDDDPLGGSGVEHPPTSSVILSETQIISEIDSLDSDVVKSYLEFSLASLIFYTMKEGACSEQSSRMTAMDNASKNAGEMIDKLTLTFNRTRQAVITRELIEIISGAAALT